MLPHSFSPSQALYLSYKLNEIPALLSNLLSATAEIQLRDIAGLGLLFAGDGKLFAKLTNLRFYIFCLISQIYLTHL